MSLSQNSGFKHERHFVFGNASVAVNGNAAVIILLLCLPFCLTYIATWIAFAFRLQSTKSMELPPIVPYAFLFIGHSWPFMRNALSFCCSVT